MVDRKLGRGLDFFLSGIRGGAPAAGGTDETLMVEVGRLVPSPNQPRRTMGETELGDLANSIRASGILQPILARRVGEKFEIVAGERRWRAAQIAGLEKVPVLVRTVSDDESAVFGLVENIQREDLNAIEKAEALRKLLQRLQCNHEDLGQRVGMDRSSVANLVRLLELPEPVQAHVSRGTLTMGHARALLGLSDSDSRLRLAEDAIRRGLSVRDVEAAVRHILEESSAKSETHKPTKNVGSRGPLWVKEIEETLVETLGTKVTVRYGRKQSQIIIECGSREEFERIYDRLKNA